MKTRTQSSTIGTIALWLLVMWVSIQFGAGLYEKRVIVPIWMEAEPHELTAVLESSGQKDSAFRLWAFVSPPVALLALINLILAYRSTAHFRRWWLTGSVVMLANSVFTYGYFVPEMIKLWDAKNMDPRSVTSLKDMWVTLNYLRLGLAAMGWMALLKAFSMSGGCESRPVELARNRS